MNRKSLIVLFSCLILYTLTHCVSQKPINSGDPSGKTPNAEREFRAAWVATVANINWPSKRGISVEERQPRQLPVSGQTETEFAMQGGHSQRWQSEGSQWPPITY